MHKNDNPAFQKQSAAWKTGSSSERLGSRYTEGTGRPSTGPGRLRKELEPLEEIAG